MKNLTLSFMKENKPIQSKRLLSLNNREKNLLVKIIPFLVIISAIFRLLRANNHFIFSTQYLSNSLLIGTITVFLFFAFFLFNGLFNNKQYGWVLLCIFQGILLIYDLSVGNTFTGVFTGLIGGWILIQVKEKYEAV
jgi:hypothetical protein